MTTPNRILFILSFVFSLIFWILALLFPKHNFWQWYLPFWLAFYLFYIFAFREPDFVNFQIYETMGAWSTLLLVLLIKAVIKLLN